MAVAVGIKKAGVDFESMDGELSRIFVLIISPKKTAFPHIQFLAAIGAVLSDESVRTALLNAGSTEQAARLLRKE